MKKMFLTLTLLIISTLSLTAQTEATTKEGKKVILNEDGTWKYVEKEITLNPNTTTDYDCSDYISTEVDKVTGKSVVAAKEMLIVSKDGGKKGFGFYILKSSKGSIIFSIQAVGAGNCIDDNDKMNVLFRDGTRIALTNDSDFNCDAEYTQYFGSVFGKKKELEMFKSKEVETIRIWTSNGYVEEDFSPEQSKQLMRTVSCLTNEQ